MAEYRSSPEMKLYRIEVSEDQVKRLIQGLSLLAHNGTNVDDEDSPSCLINMLENLETDSINSFVF